MPRLTLLRSIGRASVRCLSVVAAVALCSAMLLAAACTTRTETPGSNAVPAAVVPNPYDLSTPALAVDSYLRSITYAYRMMNSDVCTPTMTPEEWVRADAYIQLNAQKKRGLDQHLVKMSVRSISEEGTSAVVAQSEEWKYRYFTPEPLVYSGPEYSASYDTTYTLVNVDGTWLVDGVEALPLSEVP